MNVTRDVIYDLLPGYFSGDISPDTRTLVEEFLRQDPEFSRMMERFRVLFQEPRPKTASAPIPSDTEAFERARTWLQKRSELRGYVVAFGIAAAAVTFVLFARLSSGLNIGPLAIALAFAGVSAISAIQLYRLTTGSHSSRNAPR